MASVPRLPRLASCMLDNRDPDWGMLRATGGAMPFSRPDLSRRVPQLDGLRGVAIAMVVAFHFAGFAVIIGAPRLVKLLLVPTSLCWSGVDLFFVLSGFLIGGILLDARRSSNYFRVFYVRRICRILPLYLAFLGVVFLISRYGQQALWSAPWWTCLTFCQNLWMAVH